jgi:hypothetical protein
MPSRRPSRPGAGRTGSASSTSSNLGGVEWDSALGGEAVAGRVRGLSLVSSRLDVDGGCRCGLGVHGVDDRVPQRPRTVPARGAGADSAAAGRRGVAPDAVGERRGAGGGVRGTEQRAARPIRRSRSSSDGIPCWSPPRGRTGFLMQCFPVPPNGGTMKVRLGITAPLTLAGPDRAALAWPRFLERNFAVPRTFTHGVWLETPPRYPNRPARGARVHRRPGTDQPARRLARGDAGVGRGDGFPAPESLRGRDAQAPDRRSAEPGWVEQRIERGSRSRCRRGWRWCVDTSRGMDDGVRRKSPRRYGRRPGDGIGVCSSRGTASSGSNPRRGRWSRWRR